MALLSVACEQVINVGQSATNQSEVTRVKRALAGAEARRAADGTALHELRARVGLVRPAGWRSTSPAEYGVAHFDTVRALVGQLRARSVYHSESVLNGGFVWAHTEDAYQPKNGGFRPGQFAVAGRVVLLDAGRAVIMAHPALSCTQNL
jgi:hypothetical protein